MFAINGQWYTSTMWMGGSNTSNIAQESYGSRTCIGLSGASSAWGRVDFPKRIYPSATASDDARKMACITRLRFATETLNLTAGDSQQIALIILSDYQDTSTSRIDVGVYVWNDGGTYKIRLYYTDYAASSEWSSFIGTVTAGTTFYKLELYAYLDKISAYLNDTWVEDYTIGTTKTDLRIGSLLLYYEDTHAVWHLDDGWMAHEEVDFSTAAGRSTTNGSPDDGKLYLIKTSVISDAITAGDAWELDIGDGSYTGAPTDEDDYLAAKVLDGNDGGFAVKLAYSASAGWVTSEWSL